MPRSRYRIFETGYPYFFTCTINAWLPVFFHPWAVEIIINSWRHLQAKANLQLFGYVIMENHLHFIAQAAELPELVRRFKSFTARQIIDEFSKRGHLTMLQELKFYKNVQKSEQEYQLWKEGAHPQQNDNDEMMLQKLEYMRHNPLRRGYVVEPRHWRYSSAGAYLGEKGLIEVVTDWRL